uniref:Apolipoprotein L n=1 Tax=Astyanax mexicanus TaxID=7994 RepID=A0A3B1JJC3_ASTMX
MAAKVTVFINPSFFRSRDPLEEQLRNYTLDTISDFKTVKNFVAKEEHWNYRRTLELRLMSHSKSDPITKNKKQLQKNLESRMWETNAGLKQLQIFLDAVERLAVTSPFIFHNESCLLEGVDAKDESFRLMYLFGVEHANMFIDVYNECESEMDQFLSDLEKAAAKLDSLKTGSRISNITGCTAGVLGGALTIAGLALAPVTLGTSMALTFAGVGLGVASGATGISTAVNKHHEGNANDIVQKLMKDMQKILDCLDNASCQCPVLKLKGPNVAFTAGNVAFKPITVEANAGRKIPKLAANLPDIKKLAKGTPLALSKTARAGFVGLNVLFIGLDIYSICSESKSLAKGEQCRMSQLIRSRSSLWRTEINNWDRMYGCLCKGKDTFRENLCILDQPLNNV